MTEACIFRHPNLLCRFDTLNLSPPLPHKSFLQQALHINATSSRINDRLEDLARDHHALEKNALAFGEVIQLFPQEYFRNTDDIVFYEFG